MLSQEEAQYCYFGITFNKNTQGLIKWPKWQKFTQSGRTDAEPLFAHHKQNSFVARSALVEVFFSSNCSSFTTKTISSYDIRHNDIQYNDTRHDDTLTLSMTLSMTLSIHSA